MRALPDGIEARRARAADIDTVLALVEAELARYGDWASGWTPEPPRPEIHERLDPLYDDDERAWVLLAFDAEGAAGVVSLSTTTGAMAETPPPGTVYLWQLFARRDWQGRGLAGALLDRVLEEARRRGYTRIILWAAAGAAQARRFYEKEGFTLSGRDQPDTDFGLPLVEYERIL